MSKRKFIFRIALALVLAATATLWLSIIFIKP